MDKYSFLTVHVTFPFEKILFDEIQINQKLKKKYNFIITSNEDYEESIEIIRNYKIENYSFSPYLLNNNLDFIEENLMFRKDEVADIQLSKQNIYINQKINTNYFGKFIITPAGEVYSNPNTPSVGNIKINTILELIDKEFIQLNGWRKLRGNVAPCKSCIYNHLCPPISNYDYILKRFDLCIDN